MTDDDQGGFHAPPIPVRTPTAVRLAGQRLHAYADRYQVPADVGILDMPIPPELEELQQDQRFLAWYIQEREAKS